MLVNSGPEKVALLVSGFILLFLSILGVYVVFVYKRALEARNMDLILNTVVLIFIVQLDDQICIILKNLLPS